MSSRYFGAWSDHQGMQRDFFYDDKPTPDFPADADIVIACYDVGNWEGSATVIYRKDGKLMEISSGHCSCNGLEWDTGTEISWEYLAKRLEGKDGYRLYGLDQEAQDALKAMVKDGAK